MTHKYCARLEMRLIEILEPKPVVCGLWGAISMLLGKCYLVWVLIRLRIWRSRAWFRTILLVKPPFKWPILVIKVQKAMNYLVRIDVFFLIKIVDNRLLGY